MAIVMNGNSDALVIGSIVVTEGQQFGMPDITLSDQLTDTGATVVGRVFFGKGNPIVGALVELVKYDIGQPGGSTPISHTTTGFDGFYLLKLPVGDYTNDVLYVVASYPYPHQ